MSKCKDCAGKATPIPGGRSLDTRGRVPAETVGNIGPMRSLERTYDVQAFTGYAVSTNPAGQWQRGQIDRWASPVVALHSMGPMYDPTDPATWRPGL